MARTTAGFLDKLVGRLERLDPESLQAQFTHLARERGLLETVFQSIQEGVVVASAAGRLRYANAAAEQMLGIESGRLRGRSIARLFPDVDWERLAGSGDAAWQQLSSFEMEVLAPARRVLSVYAAPLAEEPAPRRASSGHRGEAPADPRDAKPGAPLVLLMLRDVTRDRDEAAEALESERLNAIRGLASSVAHEIGNPLSSLLYRLRLLRDDLAETRTVTDQTFEDLRVAENEIARIDLILKQFLGAMRPSPPVFAKDSIARVVEETVAVMRPEFEDRRIQVIVNRPEEVPAVSIDANQMKQVFFNILRNALQAMPGGGHLALGIEADDRSVSVSVRDTGSGIPEAEFRRIFEPYHTTKKNGNGIGLMIVQRIVRDHGGLVEVASKPGEGTVFRIVLPLADRRTRLLTQA